MPDRAKLQRGGNVPHRFRCALSLLALWCTALGLSGCGARAAKAPIGVAPTPDSVTRAQPGGDSADPHWAALQRQLNEPWGRGVDRDDQLIVPLVDAQNWKRVRFWLLDHFTGFRYGEDFHAVNVVFVQDMEEGRPATADSCLKQAEKWARPQLQAFDVRMGPIRAQQAEWRKQALTVRTAEAVVDYGFGPAHFSAAWTAYPAYSDACLVFAFAVPWREQRALADQVRERWITEGVGRIKPKTEKRPYRKRD